MALLNRGKLFAGALFAGALFGGQIVATQVDLGGLLRPIRTAVAPEVATSVTVTCRYVRPTVSVVRVAALTPSVSHTARVKSAALVPETGTELPVASARIGTSTFVVRPLCTCTATNVSASVRVAASSALPTGGATAPHVTASCRVHYALWTPTTVQNPTPEMIASLFG